MVDVAGGAEDDMLHSIQCKRFRFTCNEAGGNVTS
jgi:hypothetical protein